MDPHIIADPDPRSQNLVDPTDPGPDPKHWFDCLSNMYVQMLFIFVCV